MKINANLVLKGPRIALVPYLEEHVPIYNEWMKDEELLEMTASEPLSLEQEYEMQASWRIDEKKCTFIVLQIEEVQNEQEEKEWKRTSTFSELGRMIGDCNLYFNVEEEPSTAEIEIMIAESSARGKGLSTEILAIFIEWAYQALGVRKLMAKISLRNDASLHLFEKKLGFVQVSRSEVFQEITLEHCSLEQIPKISWTILSI